MDPLTIILLALAAVLVLLALLRIPGIIVRTREAVEAIRAAFDERRRRPPSDPGGPDDASRSA